MGIAEDLILIILSGFISGIAAHKIKIPPIIGYIIAGIMIGPGIGLINTSEIHNIELLAEIGVALLLFSIGLDFSFRELKTVKAIALIGTPLQILLLIAYGSGIGFFLDLPWKQSLIFGMIISLSSTMVVLKSLMNRGLIGTLSSKVMIGILIIQDLAAIPLMLIIPELGDTSSGFAPLVLILAKASLLLVVIILVGIKIVPWILKFIARLNSRELFLITVTALGLGIGYLTHLFGLSLAFGAFIAGMVINESDYSHQALSDIIPLRDIFGLVFFTSIGMLLDPALIYENMLLIIILVALIIAGKFIVFFLLGISFRYHNIIPLALGFGLSQVGEFSFVLARTGLTNNVIDSDFYSLVLSVSVITMLASPFLSLLSTPVYALKRKWFRHENIQTINMPREGLSSHVIIAGGGRVGFQIATILHRTGYPFIIIEQDYRRFEKAQKAGYPIIYGDAGQDLVIRAANIDRALMVIITIPLITTAREIIATAGRYNSDVKIIARADELSCVDELLKMNVFEVVQPEFEASLEIIRKALLLLDIPLATIHDLTEEFRNQNYSCYSIENLGQSQLLNIKKTPFLLEMSWIEISQHSKISDRSIGELAIRSKTGVSVVGVFRDNKFIPNPEPDFRFRADDLVAIIGLPENKKLFTAMIS